MGVDATICAGGNLASSELQATLSVIMQSEMFVVSAQALNIILAAQTGEKVLRENIITYQLNKLHILIAAYISAIVLAV